jgi:hypothetical protein
MEEMVWVNVQARRMEVNLAPSKGSIRDTMATANDPNSSTANISDPSSSSSSDLIKSDQISSATTAATQGTQLRIAGQAGLEMASGLARVNHHLVTIGLINMPRISRLRLRW